MENTNTLKENSITIQNELEWLSNLIDNRLDYFFTSEFIEFHKKRFGG